MRRRFRLAFQTKYWWKFSENITLREFFVYTGLCAGKSSFPPRTPAGSIYQGVEIERNQIFTNRIRSLVNLSQTAATKSFDSSSCLISFDLFLMN